MFARFPENLADAECAICGKPAVFGHSADGAVHDYICGRCGAYRIAEEVIWELPSESHPLFENIYKISWAFRQASENFEDLRTLPVHVRTEVGAFLNAPDPSVEEKLGSLLRWIGKTSKAPGRFAIFDHINDFTLLGARDKDEATFLVEALTENRLITRERTIDGYSCQVAATGWAEIQRQKQNGADSNTVFIAMSFSETRKHVEQAITSAIIEAGYRPVRMDRVEHTNRIDDEIISQLRLARFLVADLTAQNNGVYFEAGFMLGLGRPVVWACDKSDLDNVHFDMRQYNTIDYENEVDLQTRLRYRIEASVGRGSLNPRGN